MKIRNLFNIFYREKKQKEKLDINSQVKKLANLFVDDNKSTFPNLDYSLKSLQFIDTILKNHPLSKKEYVKDKYCYECEKLAAYLLQTLKNNFSGDIIWEDDKQLLFIFTNYKEFNSYKYVRKQRAENNDINTAVFLKNLSK